MRIALGAQASPTQNLIAGGAQVSARNEDVATDPYWANVVLLVGNDNAADGSTTFADQSSGAHTITANGNVSYSDLLAPTGMTTSILSDGTGDFLSSASHADWAMGSGDFTWEAYVYANGAYGGDRGIISTNGINLVFYHAVDFLKYYNGDNNIIGAAVGLAAWHHVAVCKGSGSTKMFIDGTQTGSTYADSGNYTQGILQVGAYASTSSWKGNLCSVRMTKGIARYTADFTQPTLPLPIS